MNITRIYVGIFGFLVGFFTVGGWITYICWMGGLDFPLERGTPSTVGYLMAVPLLAILGGEVGRYLAIRWLDK